MTCAEQPGLLCGDDCEPVGYVNEKGASPFLLIGDHAGRAVPKPLAWLGIPESELGRHIGHDIGTFDLGTALAERLDAVFVHQRYSRLVVDCNRDPNSPEAMLEMSDGTPIPGNCGLSPAARQARVTAIHSPYHDFISQLIADRTRDRRATILISVHSFTPTLGGTSRPWDIGVLHDGHEDAFAKRLLKTFRRDASVRLGDNEPYAMDATDYSIPRHAFGNGLAYSELEVRQDLISDKTGQALWCESIANALTASLDPGSH